MGSFSSVPLSRAGAQMVSAGLAGCGWKVWDKWLLRLFLASCQLVIPSSVNGA